MYQGEKFEYYIEMEPSGWPVLICIKRAEVDGDYVFIEGWDYHASIGFPPFHGKTSIKEWIKIPKITHATIKSFETQNGTKADFFLPKILKELQDCDPEPARKEDLNKMLKTIFHWKPKNESEKNQTI